MKFNYRFKDGKEAELVLVASKSETIRYKTDKTEEKADCIRVEIRKSPTLFDNHIGETISANDLPIVSDLTQKALEKLSGVTYSEFSDDLLAIGIKQYLEKEAE